jgi:predicted porin
MHIAGRFLAALALILLAGSANAAIVVKSDDGWSLTVGGFVNGFVVSESGDAAPAGKADLYARGTDDSTIRIRTGLLPGLIGFTMAAPEVDGIKTAARVGFWPQVNGLRGGRTTINGANIDLRELNLTFEGKFGQVLIGRALALYQGKNILTDMTLFGVGVSGPFDNGPTLGHIGIGYLYPSFVSQMRYTTPSFSGVKLAVAVVDPADPTGGAQPTVLGSPTTEAELSFAGKSGTVSYQAFASGVYQDTKIVGNRTVTSVGGAGGVGVGFAGLDLLASGFIGSAIGTDGIINSGNTLDSINKERTTSGFLGQATYTIGKVKLGANYGRTDVKKTDQDEIDNAPGLLDNRQSFTGAIWYDLVPSVKLVAEYTHLDIEWADASKQGSDTVAVGGFIFF